jgi:ketosteroid isomerase-like protein
MPWFPEFISAVELVRRQTSVESRADPVAQYFTALNEGDTSALESVWPGDVVVYDPRAGKVHGHRQLRQFVHRSSSRLAERHARVETMASTSAGGRAVVELLAHLAFDGRRVEWPVAVVAESHDDFSIEFRTYCSQTAVDGERYIRPPILTPGSDRLGDIVGQYHAALDAGDADEITSAFSADGYFTEPHGPPHVHRGARELRSFFAKCFSAGGGGIGLQHCIVTDDGVRCAVEYNCVRWGRHELPPQAGIGIYERGADGLLAAARVYDDVEALSAMPDEK